MKLYPVKQCPHLDYLHLKYQEKCQNQNTRIIKTTITVSQRYLSCLIVVQNNKIYLLQTEIGSKSAKEYQLLIELQKMFDIILIDEIIVIVCNNDYVGWQKIQKLRTKEKFGKIRITKQSLNYWSFFKEADQQNKYNRLSHFQITKIGSQIVAIYSHKKQLCINRIDINNKRTTNAVISLQSLQVNTTFSIANLVVSKNTEDCAAQNKQIIVCILLTKIGPKSVQQLVYSVYIRLLDDQKISVSSERIFEFSQSIKQFQQDGSLKICEISNKALIIHYRKQLIFFNVVKESHKMAVILNISENIIDMIAISSTLTNQNILLTISQKQNKNYILHEYQIDKLISLQELSPTNISLKRRSNAFICFISMKTTDNAITLLHFTDSTYYIQDYFISLSSIINGKRQDPSQENQQQIITFQEEIFRMNSTAINSDLCHLLPLTKIKEIIDHQRQHFVEILNQSIQSQLLLQRVLRINCEAVISKISNLWVNLFEFIREYLTIFLYLVKFIQYLRSDGTKDTLFISNNIKDLLRQFADREIEMIICNSIPIDHKYYEYEKLIIPKLKLMQTHLKIIAIILTENYQGKNSSPIQISSHCLTFRNVILELGFPRFISYCLNPQQFTEYLIYKIYIAYNQKNYPTLKTHQQLLAKIIQQFKDYPPLACLIAGETQLFYLNKIHLRRCLQEIEAERQDNENQFAHLTLLDSVNLKLQRYLTNHNLQNLVIFSQSQSITDKYSSLDIAVRIDSQYSQNMQSKSKLGRMLQTNNYITLNESQILKILDESTTTELNIGLSIATDNKYFQFSQQIELLNTKLLILLKSHYSQMTKIRNYNLQITYNCQMISNEKFIPICRLQNSNKTGMISEWKLNKFKQILSNYYQQLLTICLQYRINNFTQFLGTLLEQYSNAYDFQKYLKKQQKFDRSQIIKLQSEQKFIEKQLFETNKDEKLYTNKLSQILDRLYQNLVIINTSQFEIEEQMQNQVFLHQFIKIKGYLTNKSTIKPNQFIIKQSIMTKKPNSLYTKSSPHKNSLSINKTNQKINPEQSPIHHNSSSSIADYLINISYNRNRYTITHSKKSIGTESLQNLLQLSFQYHCSIFIDPLDILQQLFSNMHMIKQNENGQIERYGLHAIIHLFQFHDI